MSTDRGGLLKSRAESFARHLRTRLKTLSESQDDGWREAGDTEVYYDVESPLASPEEEAAEPVFTASLQRTDSEASTYYDSLDSVEELKTMSPVGNGTVDFSDYNTNLDMSSMVKLKRETLTDNTNSFCDAGNSGTFDSLRLVLEVSEDKTDNACDIDTEKENCSNFRMDFENGNDVMFGLESNNCGVTVVDVDTRQSEDTYRNERSEDDVESNDMYCVYCDIEQIKTDLASDCDEKSRIRCENETNSSAHLNGLLEEDSGTETSERDKAEDNGGDSKIKEREIPRIVVGSTNESYNSDDTSSLSNVLQKLKIEMDRESSNDEGTVDTEYSLRPQDLDFAARESSAVVETKSKRNELDEFDIETKRKHFRRSSSLKSGKTPPGTPGRKKIVRFADVLGLDLADVKTFLDEVPTVPKSAYEDLHDFDLMAELATESLPPNTITVVAPQLEKMLTPLFQQPCVSPDFLDRVRQHNVSLENAVVSDMSLFAVSGLVRVKNMDFHKSVHVRYSINNWHSFSDLQARYIPDSCDGFSDKFSFTLYGHTLTVGQKLEFAVRFQAAGAQYWDNNAGLNYVFVCNSLQPPAAAGPPGMILAPGSSNDVTAAFY